jgi:hypothetical protein
VEWRWRHDRLLVLVECDELHLTISPYLLLSGLDEALKGNRGWFILGRQGLGRGRRNKTLLILVEYEFAFDYLMVAITMVFKY